MNRRPFLSVVFAMVMAFAPLILTASDVSAPSGGHQLLATNYRSGGDDFTRFHGEPVASDALVHLNHYRAGRLGGGSDRTLTVGQLLQGAAPAMMVTAEPQFFIDSFNNMSVEERAIRDIRVRVQHGGNVNVLLGEMFGLRANKPGDYAFGNYDTTVSPLVYDNSFLYVEKQPTGTVAVVVTVAPTNEHNVNNYHADSLATKPGLDDFFSGAQGVAMAERLDSGQFVSLNLPLRIWNARTVHLCPSQRLSSGCFYKFHQPDSTHQNLQQTVMVAKAGWMDRREMANGFYMQREVTPAVQLPGGKLLRVGQVYPQRLKNRFSHDPNGQLTQMLAHGGTAWSGRDLAALKAFRQR